MNYVRRVCQLVAKSLRPLLVLNLVYFGLVGAAAAYGSWNRDVHDSLTASIVQEGPRALPAVFRSYREGNVAKAIVLTFLVNLLLGSLVFITMPSLVVPYVGIALACVRAVLWGLMFAPDLSAISDAKLGMGLLIGVLIFLEGEAYVLAMLAALVQGNSFLFPTTAGVATHWQGYAAGIGRSLQLYVVIAATLAVAAMYEAVLAIYLLPLLK